MKRILITAPHIETGGVASFVKSILPYFSDAVVFRRGKREGESWISSMFRSIFMPLNFICCILKFRPRYVIVNSSLSKSMLLRDGLLVRLSRIAGLKVLLFVHGFQKQALVNKFLLKHLYFKADSICVLSGEFKELLQKAGFDKSVYVKENPVSEDILNNNYPVRDSLSRLLFLSRIEEYKGIYIAIDTFRLLKAKYADLHFDIVGDGSVLSEVKSDVLKNKIEGVSIHGYKSGLEKRELIEKSDVLLFPTYNEGLPICVLEAMAAGLAVITRPVGGLVDLFQRCKFGDIIDSKDPEDFAMSYIKMRENLESVTKLRENNKQYAFSHFSPKKVADDLEFIVKSL